MDTDDLTEMAWDVIVRAALVSDTLKAELGALARQFKSEDEWLRGVQAHLEEIIEDPDEYADFHEKACQIVRRGEPPFLSQTR
jgi:hypothetical protein